MWLSCTHRRRFQLVNEAFTTLCESAYVPQSESTYVPRSESTFVPQSGSSGTAETAYRRGVQLCAASSYSAAISAFGEATRATHSNSRLAVFHSRRSACAQKLDRWVYALHNAQVVTELAPAWATGWARLGLCLARKDKHWAAAAAYAEARRRSSTAASAEDYRRYAAEQRAETPCVRMAIYSYAVVALVLLARSVIAHFSSVFEDLRCLMVTKTKEQKQNDAAKARRQSMTSAREMATKAAKKIARTMATEAAQKIRASWDAEPP